ncbi:hypothetical protein NDU88_002260 [Pleurodeles waltl]|uniref:Uncharacterized protein n=1 Tax=Pleurodeles waltl TaxID=8319 RepID=A0AAV7MM41_PLEWA|nr:hypothetical protein NDU88_002260 [Pleurodeles waltl]
MTTSRWVDHWLGGMLVKGVAVMASQCKVKVVFSDYSPSPRGGVSMTKSPLVSDVDLFADLPGLPSDAKELLDPSTRVHRMFQIVYPLTKSVNITFEVMYTRFEFSLKTANFR